MLNSRDIRLKLKECEVQARGEVNKQFFVCSIGIGTQEELINDLAMQVGTEAQKVMVL